MTAKHRSLNIKGPVIPDGPADPWKKPTGWFDWPKPYALQWGRWSVWNDEFKQTYPIRYFAYETVPDFFGAIQSRWEHKIKWPLLHRFHPKHQYNIIKPKLKPGYYDPDILIIESCFGMLIDLVDHHKKENIVNWEGMEHTDNAWKEMNELYDWWKNIRPTREDDLDRDHPYPDLEFREILDERYENDPAMIEWCNVSDIRRTIEEKWEQEDEDMLIRLMKIRRFLYY